MLRKLIANAPLNWKLVKQDNDGNLYRPWMTTATTHPVKAAAEQK